MDKVDVQLLELGMRNETDKKKQEEEGRSFGNNAPTLSSNMLKEFSTCVSPSIFSTS